MVVIIDRSCLIFSKSIQQVSKTSNTSVLLTNSRMYNGNIMIYIKLMKKTEYVWSKAVSAFSFMIYPLNFLSPYGEELHKFANL